MSTFRRHAGVVLTVLISAGLVTAELAAAQSDDELKALNQRVLALYNAGKYAEGIPLAERYAEAIKARHGADRPEYATALNNLALLLQDAGRLAEAEPVMRRALAIHEASLGGDHPDVATALNNLASFLLKTADRPAEAEGLLRRALAIDERRLGSGHPNVARDLNNLGQLLKTTNRFAEAEPLYRRALAIDEQRLSPDHPNVAGRLINLAVLLEEGFARYEESEALKRRALAIDEKHFGPEHPKVARDLNNLAILLQDTGRLAEAEASLRRALAIDERSSGPDHSNVATRLNNLAQLLNVTARPAEAEPLLRRAIAIDERNLGPGHPNVAAALNNLGALLYGTGRPAEAEALMRRALAIDEKSFGPEHPSVAVTLNNLARLLKDADRMAEAEPLMRRALAIDEKSFGSEHPRVATALSNLAQLLNDTRRPAEAEPLMRRALAIYERKFGPDHPRVATALNNLAQMLRDANRLGEAEPMMRRVVALHEKALRPGYPNVAAGLGNLATLRAERGDWQEAVSLHRRAKAMLIARHSDTAGDRAGLGRAALGKATSALRGHARALHHAAAGSAAARAEGFELAQWALQTSAADALAQMSQRFAAGMGPLAALVRERQDLIATRLNDDKRLLAAVGAGDSPAATRLRERVAALDTKLDAIDRRLAAEFPGFAELANPKPLTIAATQALLRSNEALVQFLDVPQFGTLAEETLVWIVTKETARWQSVPLGTRALADRVTALRCGLDATSWDDASEWPQETPLEKERVREQQARRSRCRRLLGLEASPADWPPFDVVRAHELYQALLAPVADLTSGKHLIIVPSGPLTTLPFHVLVTERPDPALSGMARYRKAAWLALRQSTTILPSVGSLQALRKLAPSRASQPYLAFGNPLLDGRAGDQRRAELARSKQTCPPDPKASRQQVSSAPPGLGAMTRGGVVDLHEARAQAPLPETADELCAVAKALGALDRERETVWLGARATERNIKALSSDGKLARFSVLHFATHGLLSGESEAILRARAEPALLLTPPKDGTSAAELETDDGLLTASEVAQLDLDADWVVLSACNTAAGDKGDAEALAGLARTFFLCQDARLARLALVRELGHGGEDHHPCFRRAAGHPGDGPRRGPPPLDAGADRQWRAA